MVFLMVFFYGSMVFDGIVWYGTVRFPKHDHGRGATFITKKK